MDHRANLQSILEKIDGVKKVYFDPPVTTKLEYPCIKYSLNRRTANYADNIKYIKGENYILIFITRDPVSAPKVLDQLEDLNGVNWDRHYIADGLHHYVYTKTY